MTKTCEKCLKLHEGTYGSGRFCSQKCAKGRSGENHPQYGKRGVDSPNYGRKVSEEVKETISKKLLGRVFSEETRRAMSEAKLGCKLLEEHKKNISKGLTESDNHPMRGKFGEENPNYGKPRDPEVREKISKSNMGKVFSEEHRRKLSEANSCSEGRTKNRGARAGWVGNLWFHSAWEVGFYLHYLEYLKIPIIRNCKANGLVGFPYLFDGVYRTYYPDFHLPETDEWVEIKGCFFDDEDRVKWEAKFRQFPHKLTLIFGQEVEPFLKYARDTYGKDFSSVVYGQHLGKEELNNDQD